MPAFFIALEGTEGSGKTTVANRLVSAYRALGREAIVTREPGGTAIGEEIRTVLFGSVSSTMHPNTEALLFAAARAQHVAEIVKPALERGAVVVTDRFIDSSLAYQWGGRGLPRDAVVTVQRLAAGDLEPQLKLLLDLPVEIGLHRKLSQTNEANRLDRESLQFHARVRDAYLSLAADDPERWRIIDASRPHDQVWRDVWNAVVDSDPSFANDPRERRARKQRWAI